MNWFSILKSQYNFSDINTERFAIIASLMPFYRKKIEGDTRYLENYFRKVMDRFFISNLRHEKISAKDRMIFRRVASARGIKLEESQIFNAIGISGSKATKSIFPIPLDISFSDINKTADWYKKNRLEGTLAINTEGTVLYIDFIIITAFDIYMIKTKMTIKKPDREIGKFLKELKSELYDYHIFLTPTTNMKYKNGTQMNIENFYAYDENGEYDYVKIMKNVRNAAVFNDPEKTLFEERVEQKKLSQRDNLWAELRDTYTKPYYDVYGRREKKK